MSLLLPLAARLHGALGLLAIAALVHPLVRRGSRRPHVAGAALAAVTFASGCLLYPSYRVLVRRALFVAHPALGWAFERKEHIAVAAVALALAGALLGRAHGAEKIQRFSIVAAIVGLGFAALVGAIVASAAPLPG